MRLQRLRTQTMSERLKTSLCIIDISPQTRSVWLWQAIHGNTPFAIVQLVFAFLLMSTLTNDEIPKGDRFMNLFVADVLLVTSESILFWTYRRARAEAIVKYMIGISTKIESLCGPQQLSTIRLVAGFSKILCKVYYTNMFTAIIVYATYPFIQWCNLGVLPMLGDSSAAFWFMYFAITIMFSVGPIATISFLAYHLQTCICLSALFQTLGKQVEQCQSTNALDEILHVHQELLRITYIARDLFYRSCFFQIAGYVSILIANTAILTEEQNLGVAFVIGMNISFIYFMCALSEAITTSCANIGEAAYCSEWLTADLVYKKKVLFIITKCSRLVFIKAGWIGPLELHKFMRAMKLWYQIVQALLNLA